LPESDHVQKNQPGRTRARRRVSPQARFWECQLRAEPAPRPWR
jgi:hypothetical protein